ncbi:MULTISPECIES: class I SAM-dependent methyltransferase [Halobacterium]|uniref:class I SAM-dependent methyltransferase n=1 Tax=Halobacterium TaxID=2239 RepID=UPI00073F322E|nr:MULTISPECIES: class I SAM-dependent methyltransferase [Halobacterium]MCD2203948.1 class I SAM-dependent methyltransferase [Halobacterium sp. KA-6]MCG1004841.1 class I SAM-dependent methyltransferase [Halobacterium noricense]
MGHHTFDAAKATKLEGAATRYRYLSREELLWALDPNESETVADLGSGTGFYTDTIAPHVGQVYAIDIQEAMHEYYRDKGVPENTELVTSGVDSLPFETGKIDTAVSTMTYHEFASAQARTELARVLAPGGRLVIGDWSADGAGEDGPPLEERFTAGEVTSALRDAGFEIDFQATRPETFLVVGCLQ